MAKRFLIVICVMLGIVFIPWGIGMLFGMRGLLAWLIGIPIILIIIIALAIVDRVWWYIKEGN